MSTWRVRSPGSRGGVGVAAEGGRPGVGVAPGVGVCPATSQRPPWGPGGKPRLLGRAARRAKESARPPLKALAREANRENRCDVRGQRGTHA